MKVDRTTSTAKYKASRYWRFYGNMGRPAPERQDWKLDAYSRVFDLRYDLDDHSWPHETARLYFLILARMTIQVADEVPPADNPLISDKEMEAYIRERLT